MKLKYLLKKLEMFYPQTLAEEWDNVGLQLGESNQEVNKILTALEITPEVVNEAIEKGVDLIVAHHPLIFKDPLYNLNFNTPNKKIIKKLIKYDIAVYVMHTNVDIAQNGMNDWISQELNIRDTSILTVTEKKSILKVNLEVNETNLENIFDVLVKLGISRTRNNLQNVSFAPKIKRFQNNNMKEAKEIDTIIVSFAATEEQIFLLKETLENMKKEQYFNYYLEILETKYANITNGLGRIGYIKPTTLENLANEIKEKFENEDIKIVGSREKIIKKVAVVGGSGSSELKSAYYKNCDVLITGDVGFHTAQEALNLDVAIIDAGHYLEIIFNDAMANFINMFDGIKAYPSEINTNPFERI